MSSASVQHDDLSPEDFLKRVKTLTETKDREDRQRAADLEKDIAQSREQRKARRADHARSLSSAPQGLERVLPAKPTSPASSGIVTMADPPESPTTLARSGTLSWQQRRRPLSMVAAENNLAHSPSKTTSSNRASAADEIEPSRAQIAESLGAKDPSWFKQTSERGIGSAAYRKSQDDPVEDRVTAGRFKLPGLSQDTAHASEGRESPRPESTRSISPLRGAMSPQPESARSTSPLRGTMSPPPEAVRSVSPSRTSSIRGSEGWNNRYSSATSTSDYGSSIKSPALDAPKLTTNISEVSSRASSRPISPTKGMGGFVQSAMMKRSDSVNKRWSATAAPGLSRGDSTASSRSNYSARGDVSGTPLPRFDARPSSLSRGNSLEPTSRPSSSHSNQTITPNRNDDKDAATRSVPSLHNRSKSMASLQNIVETRDDKPSDLSPPSSPSKRWSPTKSSWLESKLSQTEEKAKPATPPTQPSWMVDIAKAKQQRMSASIENPPKLPSEPVLLRPPSPELKSQSPSLPVLMATNSAPEPASKPPGLVSNDTTPAVSLRKSPPAPSPIASPEPSNAKSTVPGKFDFRANLKSRSINPDGNKSQEPEFKNALGNLRRAQTEKYVAPDMLKNNILRGKAGLTITGGPAKRERVDELKESLIKQKAAMKAKAAEETPDSKRFPEKPKAALPTPEALMKRNALNRADSTKEVGEQKKTTIPEALMRQKSFTEKAKPILPPKVSSPPPTSSSSLSLTGTPLPNVPRDIQIKSAVDPSPAREPAQMAPLQIKTAGTTSKLAERFNPALAGLLARGPPTSSSVGGKSSTATASKASDDDSQKESVQLTHMTKARARGPKRKAPKTTEITQPIKEIKAEESSNPSQSSLLIPEKSASKTISGAVESRAEPAPPFTKQLESAIKARPLPTPPNAASPAKVQLEGSEMKLPSNPTNDMFESDVASAPKPEQNPPPRIKSPQLPESTAGKSDTPPASSEVKNLQPVMKEIDSALGAFNFNDDTEPFKPTDFTNSTPSLGEANDYRVPIPERSPERSLERHGNVSVKGAATRWASNASPAPPSSVRARSPVKLPTRFDEDKAMIEAGLRTAPSSAPDPPKKPSAVGLGLSNLAQATTSGFQPETSPKRFPISPPSSAGLVGKHDTKTTRAFATDMATPDSYKSPADRVPSPVSKDSLKSPKAPSSSRARPPSMSFKFPPPDSPIPHSSEAARLFSEFFDDEPTLQGASDTDVLKLLEENPLDTSKVTTIRMQIQEIAGDGKLLSLPTHQEHVLFDQSIYVCVHHFQPAKGPKAIEVYLWVGLSVSPAAVEDAQLFGRKIAKDNGGKFIVLRQGKESSNFFAALGGIVITFRGSRSKSTSTGLPERFVICGRRHLGHISFDEVEFSRTSFCSGFPYLVSANSKLYLWKGEGCNAEELGCTRLIAMDLGPTPDVHEISEGSEPATFLGLFPLSGRSKSTAIPPSASHWRLKPALGDKYRARLFRVEQRPVTSKKSSAFQVSSFFSGWMPSTSPTTTTHAEQPKSIISTPTTPKSPARSGSASSASEQVRCTIEEVAPFSKEDLIGEAVWVLDAFFEVYIILSPLSTAQSQAFSAALLFAQDYGILAASVEDRPFVPVSTVVLEGAPRDMKAVFRRWDDGRESLPTENLMKGKPLTRGGSMRVVGLAAALAAVRGKE